MVRRKAFRDPCLRQTSIRSAFPCSLRRKRRFARHAPVLEIDVAGEFDRIGALKLDAEDQVIVDAAAPVVYTRLTYTLLGA